MLNVNYFLLGQDCFTLFTMLVGITVLLKCTPRHFSHLFDSYSFILSLATSCHSPCKWLLVFLRRLSRPLCYHRESNPGTSVSQTSVRYDSWLLVGNEFRLNRFIEHEK
uniref:Uncharacterized protein n=1 Tax=Cacopsylla melanoneura TaxID=428564 RepID=A0A8D8ZK51_9HEMI